MDETPQKAGAAPAGRYSFKSSVYSGIGLTPEEAVEDLFKVDSEMWGTGTSEELRGYLGRAHLVGNVINPDEVVQRFKVKRPTLLFDLETTGIEKRDEIVQFAGALVNQDMSIGQHADFLIRNNKGFTPAAAATLNKAGITEELLAKEGIDQVDAKKKVLEYLESIHSQHGQMDIMGQNVRFDIQKLKRLIGDDNFNKYFTGDVIDTMAFAAFADTAKSAQMGSASLPRVAKHFGIDTGVSHTATDDVKTTYRVYSKLMEMFGETAGSEAHIASVKFSKISPVLGSGLKSDIGKMFSIKKSPTNTLGLLAAGAFVATLFDNNDESPVVPRKPVILRENPDIMNIDNSESKIRDQHSKFPYSRRSYEMNDPIGSHRERGGTFV